MKRGMGLFQCLGKVVGARRSKSYHNTKVSSLLPVDIITFCYYFYFLSLRFLFYSYIFSAYFHFGYLSGGDTVPIFGDKWVKAMLGCEGLKKCSLLRLGGRGCSKCKWEVKKVQE